MGQLGSHKLVGHNLLMDDGADASYSEIGAPDIMRDVLEEMVLEIVEVLLGIAGGFGFPGAGVKTEDILFVQIKDQQDQGDDDEIHNASYQQTDIGVESYRPDEWMLILDLQERQQKKRDQDTNDPAGHAVKDKEDEPEDEQEHQLHLGIGSEDGAEIESRQIDHEVEQDIAKDIVSFEVECDDAQHEKSFCISAGQDAGPSAEQKEYCPGEEIKQEDRDTHRVYPNTDSAPDIGFAETIRSGIFQRSP